MTIPLLFLILTIVFGLFCASIVVTKTYKKPFMFYLVLFTTIFYTPNVYYALNIGTAYRFFDEDVFAAYILFSTFSFVVAFTAVIFVGRVNKSFRFTLRFAGWQLIWRIVFFMTALLILFYVVSYWSYFPFTRRFLGQQSGVWVRPDTDGSIPHWFTVNSIIFLFLPIFFLYYLQMHEKTRGFMNAKNLILFGLLCIVLILGGNLGMIVFFGLFVYIYCFKYTINIGIIFAGALSLIGYYLTYFQGRYSGLQLLLNMISAPVRRFAVTQASGYIVRMQMIKDGFLFADRALINSNVHDLIYGNIGGAAPTYFTGNIFVMFGMIPSIVAQVIGIFTFGFISEYIYKRYPGNLVVYWGYCSLAMLVNMDEVLGVTFLYRFIMVTFIMSVFLLFVYKEPYHRNISLKGDRY